MIDTHCHISKEDYVDIDVVISEANNCGVNKIIISGCTKDSILESIDIANKYGGVYLTIGYHPSEADSIVPSDLDLLDGQISSNNVVGIGEIGLDYHYGKENDNLQKELFRSQMKLAEKYHLPVVIHSRDATMDTLSIVKEFPSVVGSIHCFSGSIETAIEYISLGYKIGIGGVVTFKNSNLFKVVEAIGLDNILLETDSPYLAPTPHRGEQNTPKYIPLIGERVAEILGISLEEVDKITTRNAIALFDLK